MYGVGCSQVAALSHRVFVTEATTAQMGRSCPQKLHALTAPTMIYITRRLSQTAKTAHKVSKPCVVVLVKLLVVI